MGFYHRVPINIIRNKTITEHDDFTETEIHIVPMRGVFTTFDYLLFFIWTISSVRKLNSPCQWIKKMYTCFCLHGYKNVIELLRTAIHWFSTCINNLYFMLLVTFWVLLTWFYLMNIEVDMMWYLFSTSMADWVMWSLLAFKRRTSAEQARTRAKKHLTSIRFY